MSRAARIGALAALGILITGIVLAQLAPSGSRGERPAGPSPEDAGPQGLLALSLLLDGSGHPLERIADSPADADLDRDATVLLVDPGELTAVDAESLHGVAAGGGRVVLAGDPGAAALERILGAPAEIAGGPAPTAATPLAPAPETSGIASVASSGEAVIAVPGPALPLLGGEGAVTAALAHVGEGQVLLLSDPEALENELLGTADNARFALNLAGTSGRSIQLIERVTSPPSSGLAALPPEWGWALAGLVLAALALAASRARRLGPPELEARALSPPRREYVDALAAALARTGDPAAAGAPLRAAARERLAQRAGLGPEPDEAALRGAAEAAGLQPDEIQALGDGGGEDAMLAAGTALAKLRRRMEVNG